MNKPTFLIVLCTLFTWNLFAHEGHHHGAKVMTPPKGGVMRTVESIGKGPVYLEMLQQGKMIKVFIYDAAKKPADTSKFSVSATTTKPRKDPKKLTLKKEANHWQYEFDAEGVHRYTLRFTVGQGEKTGEAMWNIEPKHQH